MLDVIAKWGPWFLAAIAVVPAAGSWQLWRSRRSLPRASFIRGLINNLSWLTMIGVSLWVLQVRMAPLTGSLVALQAHTGRRVPEISFKRVSDDAPHRLREFEGKVVLLNLWATYCPPCIQEMPTLARLQKEYEDRGLVVVALTDESPEHLRRFFQGRTGEALSGYCESFDWLAIRNFRPFTLVIDRNGILRRHFFGTASFEEFESRIRPSL